ncbi:MAG TPA: glycosyltransferase family 1 protein [Candidatus Saccharimonadales bacterium]|nr:glycosyltransferase family 1 protein [Candidatus Saccharimonadales bacterium]
MKVVIDARESGTSTGRYIDKLVENLARLDWPYEHVILTKPERLQYMQNAAPNFTVLGSPYKEFTFAEQLGFKKQLDGIKGDLVHFGMTQQPVRYRGKKVTTIHDLTTLRFNNPDKNWLAYKLKQQVYKFVIKSVTRRSTTVIVPSHFVKDDLVKFTGVNPAKIQVIYEAADQITEEATALPELEGKKFIMYVGRPTPHKNLERLLEAFQKLNQPDLYLVLAGKKDANYQRIEKQNIPNVIFTDFVEDPQLRWLYEHCAAYIFPSLSEGFGLPGLEAMAHGAPVVSSNATCLPEIYGDAAHYFDPLDVDAMAQAINDVLTDQKLRADLIQKGAEQTKEYSWRQTAEETLAVYKRVLGE